MDSHVSKKAVIDVIDNFNVFQSREDQIALERKIAELPSAEEESFEWCTDCKEYDQEAHCCHRWSKMIRKTVDEMQIVRCSECVSYQAEHHWCKLHDGEFQPTDYCSYGERKEVTG